MEMHEIRGEEAPAPAPAAFANGGGGGSRQLGFTQQLMLQAAAVAEVGGGGLIALGDRLLQSAKFFLVWDCCVLINATVVNPAANLEHKFVGFVVLTIGAWLTFLTVAGGRARRAAARAERFLRRLFFSERILRGLFF